MPPLPKHPDQRRRRNATVPMNQLPAEGRKGRSPTWPISAATPAEVAAWRGVWKLPQACVWEAQHLERIVARYVRRLVESEEPGAGAALCGQVAKLEEALLLTPDRLKRAHYEIVPAESKSEAKPANNVRRLRAVDVA